LRSGYPPPGVFWEKRLQAIENKGNECGKDRKETTKRLQADANKRVEMFEGLKVRTEPKDGPTLPGVLDGCENKEVAGKGICKVMKTKAGQNNVWRSERPNVRRSGTLKCAARYPTPRCVCVNAVDKGVSGRFGVKAVDKGLSGLDERV
jgi:hypothetical protein